MADNSNKLITLGLLSLFKEKMQAWHTAQNEALETSLKEEIGKITSFEVKLVDALPETGETGYIYFVPKAADAQSNTSGNVYLEYLWIKGTDETYAFEQIGDTQIDVSALKDEIATGYVADVDVTSEDNTDDEGVTKTTYTFTFKDGKGTALATKAITVGGGYAKATSEKDGLMSKEDKAKLDALSDSLDTAVEGIDVDVTVGDAVVTGNTSVSTVTVALKNGETAIDSGTFDVTTYGEATDEAAGLMSADDKAKLDSYVLVTDEEIEALFAEETADGSESV